MHDQPTILDELNAWLEEPQYDTGVLLYQRVIGNDFLCQVLQSGPDDYNRTQLMRALSQKRDGLQAETQSVQASYPTALQSDLEAAKLLLDERTALKEKLRNAFDRGQYDGGDNKATAYRLLAIRDTLDQTYGRRQFFEQHGYLPEPVATVTREAPTDADATRRRNTVRTYITRYTQAIRDAKTDKARQSAEEKLREYGWELAALDERLRDAVQD